MSQKAVDCLRIVNSPPSYAERMRRYEAAAAKWSAKAVDRKLEELAGRGYIECGVEPRSGWLTDKGKQALGGAA